MFRVDDWLGGVVYVTALHVGCAFSSFFKGHFASDSCALGPCAQISLSPESVKLRWRRAELSATRESCFSRLLEEWADEANMWYVCTFTYHKKPRLLLDETSTESRVVATGADHRRMIRQDDGGKRLSWWPLSHTTSIGLGIMTLKGMAIRGSGFYGLHPHPWLCNLKHVINQHDAKSDYYSIPRVPHPGAAGTNCPFQTFMNCDGKKSPYPQAVATHLRNDIVCLFVWENPTRGAAQRAATTFEMIMTHNINH